jgi:hypothetical protein
MLDALSASPVLVAFVTGLLTSILAYAYNRGVLKKTSAESNKAFFQTMVAASAAATAIALLVRQSAPMPQPEPFFAPL